MKLTSTVRSLVKARKRCALKLLGLHMAANAGHIGSSLSCLEILIELCFHRMAKDDMLVLSKGHAASALYTTLALSGRMAQTELENFYKDGTHLAAHPPCSRTIPAIPFGTGSLGHGLGLSCGLAYSQRFTGKVFTVFTVLSDGDCNEGSTWEAALFAAQDIFSDSHALRFAEKSQIFRALRSALAVTEKNIFALKAPLRTFSTTLGVWGVRRKGGIALASRLKRLLLPGGLHEYSSCILLPTYGLGSKHLSGFGG